MSETLTIPEKKYLPKTGALPKHIKPIPNWADKEETVRKVTESFKEYFSAFDGQSSRDKLMTNMDTADEMTRAAITASQLSNDVNTNGEKLDSTKTNVTSASFYRYLRAVTAWETNVMLGNEQELPVKAEPIPGTQGAREDEARAQADLRNNELAYAFEHGRLRDAIADNQFFLNKYGQRVIEMCWERQEEEITERAPITNPIKRLARQVTKRPMWEWKTTTKVLRDCPVMRCHDMRNAWFDTTVEDAQDQSCFILREQHQYSELVDMQAKGWITNMDKVTIQQRFNADEGTSYQAGKVMKDRKDNADESGSDDYTITKLFDLYRAYIRVPVSEDGDWNEKKELQVWREAWFVGDPSGSPVCVRLSPLVCRKSQIPVLIQHSLRDDKGALHVSYAELAKCNIAVDMTIWNQAIDNWKQRNRTPILAEKGSLIDKNITFTAGGNRIIWFNAGAQTPFPLRIDDTTVGMPVMLQENDRRLQDIFGVNKPFMSEALGGRTTAQEALFVTDQAVKIALEDTKYKANQVLMFVAEWTLAMMDQFADPDIQRFIHYKDKVVEVKPQEVWMPVNIRVTAVKQFQDSAIRKREEAQFINQIFPLCQPLMSAKGQINFFSQIVRARGFENIDEWWAMDSDYDAREEAKKENVDVLFYGVDDLPAQEENHAAHLLEHEPTMVSYQLLPEDQQFPDNIRKMKLHISMHRRFQDAQKAAMTAATQPSAAGGPQTPKPPETGMAGQEGGEAIAGTMGMFGNMPTPEAGGGQPS